MEDVAWVSFLSALILASVFLYLLVNPNQGMSSMFIIWAMALISVEID
jgi:hypothetical protein